MIVIIMVIIIIIRRTFRSRACLVVSFLAAQNHSAGSMDRDFGALGDLLEALLVASRCPRDLQSLKI